MKKIISSNVLEKENLKKDKFFLMSIHREENLDSAKNFHNLLDAIEQIAKKYKMPIIISTHPRTRKKLEEINYKKKSSLIRFSKPYGFHEYSNLQMNSFCVISDSGTITEESSILNLPAITIRQAHERPEGMDEGTVIMSGLDSSRIIESIEVVTSQYSKDRSMKIVKDYDVDNVSKKVLRIILSYTNYINRTVWYKGL
jgi:UDP-N-acetylglucosamine 2-epimerase (non-hydrolysing)